MNYLNRFTIYAVSILFFFSGCNNSKIAETNTKVTNFFEKTTGDDSIFKTTEQGHYYTIIETNSSYQVFTTELLDKFTSSGDRAAFTPLQSQEINFTKNRILLYGYENFLSSNLREKSLSYPSTSEAVITLYNPDTENADSFTTYPAYVIAIRGYMVDRSISSVKIITPSTSTPLLINMNTLE